MPIPAMTEGDPQIVIKLADVFRIYRPSVPRAEQWFFLGAHRLSAIITFTPPLVWRMNTFHVQRVIQHAHDKWLVGGFYPTFARGLTEASHTPPTTATAADGYPCSRRSSRAFFLPSIHLRSFSAWVVMFIASLSYIRRSIHAAYCVRSPAKRFASYH